MTRRAWLLLPLIALAFALVLLWRTSGEPSETAAHEGPVLVPWGEGLPREGQWRNGFALVDFDGDGHLDIVHGPARKREPRVPRVFRGDGAGRFREDTSLALPDVSLDYGDVAVADFDGDGRLDLALASHLQGLTMLLRRESGFVSAPLPPPVASFSSRALVAADVDGDGFMDLVASSDGPRPFSRTKASENESGLAIVHGGPGTPRVSFPTADVRRFGDSLVVGDVDGTEGVEIVTASGIVGSDRLLYRRGAEGAFVLEGLAGVPAGALTRVVGLVPDEKGAHVLLGGLVPGAAGLEGSLVVVRFADGSATRLFQGAPLRAVSALGTGDLDGDGLVDVVFGDEDGTLHVLLGTRAEGTGGFVSRGSVTPGAFAGCAAYGIALADLDGRPGDEVVVSFAGEGESCPKGGGIELFRLASR